MSPLPFQGPAPIVGMIHLAPLPGSPGFGKELQMPGILARALADARALEAGGVEGLLVENFGDAPFHPGAVPPETIAAMAVIVERIVDITGLPVGVNVLRNDAAGALAIAAATGARFIRVNVHVGTMFTDQGILEGRAHETVRARERLAPGVAILADVMVKHAVPPQGSRVMDIVADTVDRGLADAVIVTGSATGYEPDIDRLHEVRAALGRRSTPLWIGSGLTTGRLPDLLPLADGAIVGSAFHRDGMAGRGLDPARIEEFIRKVRDVRLDTITGHS